MLRTSNLTHIPVPSISLERLKPVLAPGRFEEMQETAKRARTDLQGRTVWNVNSTARGGGVAEMLQSLLGYVRGVGIDARWVVIGGTPSFFRVTKRLHNHLHGSRGDGGGLGENDRAEYERALDQNLRELSTLVRPGDIVVLHDPQPAGLIPGLGKTGAALVWRCHIGVDAPNSVVRRAHAFLFPYLTDADAYVFSRKSFVWDGLDRKKTWIIPPSIDPFSPKNTPLTGQTVAAILARAGLVHDPGASATPEFVRQDGTSGIVSRTVQVLQTRPLSPDARLVVQVSRWDRLKDPVGVMRGFAEGVVPFAAAQLMLAGPAVHAVTDDPEGAEVLSEVVKTWEMLPSEARDSVHIACLPMEDLEENAAIVNALQRRSDMVVQKSLAEGFGLTVAEAMWKARPVVASRVGGIQDQIENGVSGVLVDDPSDLLQFARAVRDLLADPESAKTMGNRARERIRYRFLGDRHLLQYASLVGSLLA
jgi:trehalose synthase